MIYQKTSSLMFVCCWLTAFLLNSPKYIYACDVMGFCVDKIGRTTIARLLYIMRRYQTVKNAITSRLIERFIIHCTIPTNAQYIKVLYATSTMGLSLLTLYKKLNRVSTHKHVRWFRVTTEVSWRSPPTDTSPLKRRP